MPATILLVDSDVESSTTWKAFLENQGYSVIGVETGSRALKLCPEVRPDLVLLHSILPDMPGFQLCRRLKAENRLMPVIIVGANMEPFGESRAYQAGADDFWSKPATRWDAINRLDTMLQLKGYIDQQGEDVLFSLARSVEQRNPATNGHSDRLAEYTVQFGRHLGLTEDELIVLRAGSLLHDIGKVAVPDQILLKPASLTREEREIVNRHPIVGEEICAPLKSFRHVLPLIRHHHERPDGSGYPDGLSGDAIPLSAQVLQMADIYDALTTDRPYRKELAPETALTIMNREANEGRLSATLLHEFSVFVWSTVPWRQPGARMVQIH